MLMRPVRVRASKPKGFSRSTCSMVERARAAWRRATAAWVTPSRRSRCSTPVVARAFLGRNPGEVAQDEHPWKLDCSPTDCPTPTKQLQRPAAMAHAAEPQSPPCPRPALAEQWLRAKVLDQLKRVRVRRLQCNASQCVAFRRVKQGKGSGVQGVRPAVECTWRLSLSRVDLRGSSSDTWCGSARFSLPYCDALPRDSRSTSA